MEKNSVAVKLTKNDKEEIVLEFSVIDKCIGIINLEDEDIASVKQVFLEISSLLIKGQVELNYTKDETKDYGNDGLLIDVADSYIETLKNEILGLEQDQDLITLRMKQEEMKESLSDN